MSTACAAAAAVLGMLKPRAMSAAASVAATATIDAMGFARAQSSGWRENGREVVEAQRDVEPRVLQQPQSDAAPRPWQ